MNRARVLHLQSGELGLFVFSLQRLEETGQAGGDQLLTCAVGMQAVRAGLFL